MYHRGVKTFLAKRSAFSNAIFNDNYTDLFVYDFLYFGLFCFFPFRLCFGGTSFPSSKVLQMMGRAKSNFCSKTKILNKLKQR